jgi:hypothetical protein
LDEAGAATAGAESTIADLSEEARSRIINFIVTCTLDRGVAPTAVLALYADLASDEQAVQYADRHFVARDVQPDWRDVEDRVMDLEDAARQRGLDLCTAWRRTQDVDMRREDPLEQLSRLAGTAQQRVRAERSIFDDPDDLDELEAEDADASLHDVLEGALPDLLDLDVEAQTRIRRFAIDEALEHGLPAVETLEMYRQFELNGDARAIQYLDRAFVEHELPADWMDLQSLARRVAGAAEVTGQDAGRLYADLMRASPALDPVVGLERLAERLKLPRLR